MSDALTAAMASLDDYMAALNRGDEAGVNAACNFPHVRLAGGKVVVWPKHGDYKLEDFRARAGDGLNPPLAGYPLSQLPITGQIRNREVDVDRFTVFAV